MSYVDAVGNWQPIPDPLVAAPFFRRVFVSFFLFLKQTGRRAARYIKKKERLDGHCTNSVNLTLYTTRKSKNTINTIEN